MAFWPTDEKTTAKEHTEEKERDRDRNYPNLEPGLIGAATLVEETNKHLRWAFVATPSNKVAGLNSQTRLKIGKQTTIFPSTCSTHIRNDSGSVQQRAEQGANFLRTFLPDVEIASELIRDRLVEETALYRELEQFDPHSGNLLEYVEPHSMRDHVMLLFPSGETNRDLSLSCINYRDDREIVFAPSREPVHTFMTPIQHLVASDGQETNLAVRTYGATKLFQLNWDSNEPLQPVLSDIATIYRHDTANEVIVDMKYLSTTSEMIFVGEKGTVFKCSVANGNRQITALSPSPLPSKVNGDGFWRLSIGQDSPTYYALSKKHLWRTDSREALSKEFYSIPSGKHCFTSVEDHKDDNIIRLCSTNQIIWMDVRFPKRPLLAYAHGREYDRYLSVNTVREGFDHPLSFLTTRSNSLTTVYDVSCSVDQRPRLNSLPYLLPSEATIYEENNGRQFISHDKLLGLLCLSDKEGVKYSELLRADHSGELNYSVRNKEVFSAAKASKEKFEDIGPLGRKEFGQINLNTAYNAVFQRYFLDAKKFEMKNAELVYQLLDDFPSYMQRKDLPSEHILSTYDILFRAGEEPEQAGRSEFLTESIINSKRGYRALTQGRLSGELIQAPFHRTITPVLRHLDKQFPMDPAHSMEYLQSFNLSEDVDCSVKSREFERESCQQLALDLALSSDIYSDASAVKAEQVDQTLEFMTEALSLGNEPPPVEFRYLRPLEKLSAYSEDKSAFEKALELPIGVRLLLKDWDDGDPEDHVYQDPYDTNTSPPLPTAIKTKLPSQTGPPPIITQSQSQKPPKIIATNIVTASKPDMPRRNATQAQSQDQFPSNLAAGFGSFRPEKSSSQSQSQELFASTQVLPGPYGGHPSVSKKKPAKKRLGGF